MADPELLRAMQAAVAVAKANGIFLGGRADTPSYSVAYNGTGYRITCLKTVSLPCKGVIVCETDKLRTHFIACRADVKM